VLHHHERDADQSGHAALHERVVGRDAQVVEHEPQRQQEIAQVAQGLVREIVQLRERARRGPRGSALIEHDGQDRGQAQRLGMLLAPALEELDDHLEHAQRHPAIDGALMLEEEPQVHLVACQQPGREHQVTVPLMQGRIDEAGVHGLQAIPVDVSGDAVRQNGAQLGRGMHRVAEDALEEPVMWL
jgi:hypothetical protein